MRRSGKSTASTTSTGATTSTAAGTSSPGRPSRPNSPVTDTGTGTRVNGLRAIDGRRAPRGAPRQDKAAARSRRRFARRQWRRRWLTWRPLLVLVLAVAIGVGGVYVVLFSSLLAVEDVEITGAETVGTDQVRALVDVRRGTPLARVDVDAIRTRVAALAPVGDVDVRRQWPHGLVVEVVERVPVAVVSIGQQLRSLDADGIVFGSYDKAPPGLPRIDTVEGTRSDALREAATVVSALPAALARRVDHAEVQTVDQVVLVLRDGRRVQWGGADDSALKAEVLGVLLAQQGTTYDVSVPGQPTVS